MAELNSWEFVQFKKELLTDSDPDGTPEEDNNLERKGKKKRKLKVIKIKQYDKFKNGSI